MHRLTHLIASTLLMSLVGCTKDADTEESESQPDSQAQSDAEWEELGESDSAEKEEDGWDDKEDEEDWDDKEDEDTGKEAGSCGDEVSEGASCEGGWEETLCYDDFGVAWWCQDGGWTSDKDR